MVSNVFLKLYRMTFSNKSMQKQDFFASTLLKFQEASYHYFCLLSYLKLSDWSERMGFYLSKNIFAMVKSYPSSPKTHFIVF
jgi:hypothetical protein